MRMLALCGVLAASVAAAAEGPVRLKDGPGKEVVEANCATCHSLDYIPMNSPFLDRKAWEGEVTKMVKAMGAPIPPEQAQKIVEYLATQYGKK